MKNPLRPNRFFLVLFLPMFSLLNPAIAKSAQGDSLVPVEMRYAGLISDKPVFQLDFVGSPGLNQFLIIVTDESGNTLYRENARGEIFSKKFLLDTDEIGDGMLKFEVRCINNRQAVSFELNQYTRTFQLYR